MSALATFATWFLIFLTYAFMGWCLELLASMVLNHTKKPSNRGFLIGPLCPIYGFGALLMTFCLRNANNILEIFMVAIISSALLEYFTSFVMEKLFKVRWWDYSEKPFNLHGRICLENLLYFGIMGIFVVEIGNPLLLHLFGGIGEVWRIAIMVICLVALLTDIGVTLYLLVGCHAAAGTIQRDATNEIAANIRDILMTQGKLRRRLAKAFPSMTIQPKRRTTTRKKETEANKAPTKVKS